MDALTTGPVDLFSDIVAGPRRPLKEMVEQIKRLSVQQAIADIVEWYFQNIELAANMKFWLYEQDDLVYCEDTRTEFLKPLADPAAGHAIIDKLTSLLDKHCTEVPDLVHSVIQRLNTTMWAYDTQLPSLGKVASAHMENGQEWLNRYLASREALQIEQSTQPAPASDQPRLRM